MAKLIAILAASAAVAGGATFAVFHHLDPNHCPLSGCEITKPACCALPATEAAAPSADATMAVAGPVVLFTESAASPCCAVAAKPVSRASCCATEAACCAPVSACCPVLTAAVGPAAAIR
jgi:hypothetical protein